MFLEEGLVVFEDQVSESHRRGQLLFIYGSGERTVSG